MKVQKEKMYLLEEYRKTKRTQTYEYEGMVERLSKPVNQLKHQRNSERVRKKGLLSSFDKIEQSFYDSRMKSIDFLEGQCQTEREGKTD